MTSDKKKPKPLLPPGQSLPVRVSLDIEEDTTEGDDRRLSKWYLDGLDEELERVLRSLGRPSQ